MTEYIGKCKKFVGVSGATMQLPEYIDINQEIVRCRDCAKWHHIDTEDGIRYGECDEWKRADSYCVSATNEDGFCAWSARKEVDNGD